MRHSAVTGEYPASRVIRMRHLRDKVALSPSHIYALIQQGTFPRPFPIVPGGRAKGWFESDVDAWLASRAKQERA